MKIHTYDIAGKQLVWEDDDDISKVKDNNLYIKDFWSMSDEVGPNDITTKVWIESKDTFSFYTWNGFKVRMQIIGEEIKCLYNRLHRF